jgi:hypothetical protein
MSLAALVSHVVGLLEMRFFLFLFGGPTAVLLVAMVAHAQWISDRSFVRAVTVGLAAGLVATSVYDAVRFLIVATGIFHYDAFYSIRIFGHWITGYPFGSVEALAAGWAYHYWNGLSFAVFFTLMLGRPRWWWYGLLYGVFMELCMLGLFPLFLRVTDQVGFITISLAGHAVYGAVLGVIASRYGLPWLAPPLARGRAPT